MWNCLCRGELLLWMLQDNGFHLSWGSHPCPDWMGFAVPLSPWGMAAGACWQLELALWRCKTKREEGKMSPVRAAGEESSRRVTLPGAGWWLAGLHVLPHVPMAPHSPKTKWCIQHCLSVSQDTLLGSLFSLLPRKLFVPGSGSGGAKLSLYSQSVLPA